MAETPLLPLLGWARARERNLQRKGHVSGVFKNEQEFSRQIRKGVSTAGSRKSRVKTQMGERRVCSGNFRQLGMTGTS